MSKRVGSEAPMGDAAQKKLKLEPGLQGGELHKPAPPFWAVGKGFPQVLYKDSELLVSLQQVYEHDPERLVEVLIPAEYVSSSNRRVKTRQIWGDGVYTGDSDIVAVLMHLGYLASSLPTVPPALLEVHVLLKLTPPLDYYPSKAHAVKSRAWCSSTEGCSFRVEACWLVTRSGAIIELRPSLEEASALHPTVHTQTNRTVTTRGAAGRGAKVGQEVSVQFNMCNEPWLKYTLPAIADRGLKPTHWTSARLVDEVLLLETAGTRYQVARTGEVHGLSGSPPCDTYSLSRCKAAAPAGTLRRLGVPLPSDHVEPLFDGLAWEELQWGMASLVVRGTTLCVRRMHFMRRAAPEPAL
ncbi:hypothetical protein FOA52_011614 [Chlamydomonas sp. UWO 241]|nr:hypothetical protein FOA52_011614 [Chlamydomonas sp. UWO 241]